LSSTWFSIRVQVIGGFGEHFVGRANAFALRHDNHAQQAGAPHPHTCDAFLLNT
jgi:hypothetical protein